MNFGLQQRSSTQHSKRRLRLVLFSLALLPFCHYYPGSFFGSWRKVSPESVEKDKALLRLEGEVCESSLKTAFRKQVVTHHPDKGGDKTAFRVRYEAYQRLRTYVASGGAGPPCYFSRSTTVFDARVPSEASEFELKEHHPRKPGMLALQYSQWEENITAKVFQALGLQYLRDSYFCDSWNFGQDWAGVAETILKNHAKYEVRFMDLGMSKHRCWVWKHYSWYPEVAYPARVTAICHQDLPKNYQKLLKKLVDYDTDRVDLHFGRSILAWQVCNNLGFRDSVPEEVVRELVEDRPRLHGIGWIDLFNNALIFVDPNLGTRVATAMNVRIAESLLLER